jgi:hypothetical protein
MNYFGKYDANTGCRQSRNGRWTIQTVKTCAGRERTAYVLRFDGVELGTFETLRLAIARMDKGAVKS